MMPFLLSNSMSESTGIQASVLVREARKKSGLSQRLLARRAGTAQSLISRIESGNVNPTTDTLNKLLAASGFSAMVELTPLPVSNSHMLTDVDSILNLTPEQRLDELKHIVEFIENAKPV